MSRFPTAKPIVTRPASLSLRPASAHPPRPKLVRRLAIRAFAASSRQHATGTQTDLNAFAR